MQGMEQREVGKQHFPRSCRRRLPLTAFPSRLLSIFCTKTPPRLPSYISRQTVKAPQNRPGGCRQLRADLVSITKLTIDLARPQHRIPSSEVRIAVANSVDDAADRRGSPARPFLQNHQAFRIAACSSLMPVSYVVPSLRFQTLSACISDRRAAQSLDVGAFVALWSILRPPFLPHQSSRHQDT